jgi:hypothetical protein
MMSIAMMSTRVPREHGRDADRGDAQRPASSIAAMMFR